MSSTTPDLSMVTNVQTRMLLEGFYALPDLLTLAKEKAGATGDPYPEQETLRKEYDAKKVAYRASMPFRHRAKCKSGEHPVAAMQYTLVDPARKLSVELWEVDIHEAQVHGAALPDAAVKFLEGLK